MSMERQTTYGWLVTIDLFLGGAGAGAFVISFILNIMGRYGPIAEVGALVGTLLVLSGALFLIADVTRKTRMLRLFCNPSSWTSRGSWIITIFIASGLAYSLPSFGPFMWLPWSNATPLGSAIGIVAALFALLLLVYTGFVFAVIKSIPLWNTSALPALFLLLGLSTGIAVLLLIASLFAPSLGHEAVSALHELGIAGAVFILAHLFVLWAYLAVASHADVASMESFRLLKTPQFFIGVVVMGLVIPLCLLLYSLVVSVVSVLAVVATTVGILLLGGGLYLRWSIIRAGVYVPRFSI